MRNYLQSFTTCINLLSWIGLIIGVTYCLACTPPRKEVTSKEEISLSFDTTMVVYDETGKQLQYSQYAALIKTGKYSFKMGNGKKIIEKMSPGILQHVKIDSSILNDLLLRWLDMADKIVVEKAKRTLYLERNGKIIFKFPIQLGRNPIGSKQKEGDGRTPEGLYNIDYNVNREPAYYHGFHISYPSEKDIARAKMLKINPGSDIMIHGTGPDRVNRKDWTNGCIAISNSQIDTLKKYTTNGISIEIKK